MKRGARVSLSTIIQYHVESLNDNCWVLYSGYSQGINQLIFRLGPRVALLILFVKGLNHHRFLRFFQVKPFERDLNVTIAISHILDRS